MKGALRSVLAVAAGFVAASIVMMIVESINGKVLYPELGRAAQGMTDRNAIRELLASAPAGAFLVVLCGWVLGSLAGGAVAGWIGRTAPARHALVLGGLLTLAGVGNNLMLPPPVWFWVVSIPVFVPAAWAGVRLAPVPTVGPPSRSSPA
jgi:hypothetical protein